MKILLYGLAGLIVLVISAILFGPSLIDWTRFKPEIIAQAAKLTGRPVAIDGTVSLRSLPAPTLTASNVRIGISSDSQSADLMTLESLEIRLAILPLIRGIVQVESLELVAPAITLERGADGANNWQRQRSAGADTANIPPDGLSAIAFTNIEISGGSVVYVDRASGQRQALTGLDAFLTAPDPTGPFSAEGEFQRNRQTFRFQSTLAALPGQGETQSIPGRLRIATEQAFAEWSGRAGFTSWPPSADGKIQIQGDLGAALFRDGAALLGAGLQSGAATITGPLAGAPASISGRLAVSDDTVTVEQLELRIADSLGKGRFEYGRDNGRRFDMALNVNRIDLEPYLHGAGSEPDDQASVGSAPDSDPVEALLEGLRLPAGLNGSIDLTVDAILYRGQVVRQTVANLGVFGGTINIQRLYGLLPGGSYVTVFGSLAVDQPELAFAGQIEAQSDNLRAVLDWLGFDIAAIRADRLRKFSLIAAINGGLSTGEISGIDLSVDTSRLRGGVNYALRARPAFGVNMVIDQLNLDAYRADVIPLTEPPPDQAADDIDPTAAAQASLPWLSALARFDADFVAKIESLTVEGVPISGLTMSGLLKGGAMTLREAALEGIAGARITVTGKVEDIAEDPLVDAALSLRTHTATELLRNIPALEGLAGRVAGPMGIEAKVAGNMATLAIEGSVAAIGGDLTLEGTLVDWFSAQPSVSLSAALRHSDAARLLGSLGGFDRTTLPETFSQRITANAALEGSPAAFAAEATANWADATLKLSGQGSAGRLPAGSDQNGEEESDYRIEAFSLSALFDHPNASAFLQAVLPAASDRLTAAFSGPVITSVRLEGDDREVTANGSVSLANAGAKLTATVTGEGSWPDADIETLAVRAEGKLNHRLPRALLDAAIASESTGLPVLDSPLSVAYELSGSMNALTLAATASLADVALSATGSVDGLPKTARWTADLEARHPDFAELARQLGLEPPPGSDGRSAAIRADIATTASTIKLAPISGDLAGAPVTGSVLMFVQEPRPRLDIAFSTGELVLVRSEDNSFSEGPNSGSLDWSVLTLVDGDFRIVSDGLATRGISVRDLTLVTQLEDGLLTIDELSGNLYGGAVTVTGQASAREQPELAVTLQANGADLAEVIFELTEQPSPLTGTFSLDAQLAAQGDSWAELRSTLSGGGEIRNLNGGNLIGLDFDDLIARGGNAAALAAFFESAADSQAEPTVPYEGLESLFEIIAGHVETRDLTITATDWIASGDAVLDATESTLDLDLSFALLPLPDLPVIGISLSGPLDNLSRGFSLGDAGIAPGETDIAQVLESQRAPETERLPLIPDDPEESEAFIDQLLDQALQQRREQSSNGEAGDPETDAESAAPSPSESEVREPPDANQPEPFNQILDDLLVE